MRECLHGVCRQNVDLCYLTDATIDFRDLENIEKDILHDQFGRQDIEATSYTCVRLVIVQSCGAPHRLTSHCALKTLYRLYSMDIGLIM